MGEADGVASVNAVEEKRNMRAVIIDVFVCFVAVIAIVGVSALLWSWGGGGWFEQPLLNVIGCVGVVVSLVGVLLAYLIFRRQSREGESANRYQRRVLADLQRIMVGVDAKLTTLSRASASVSDADAEQSSGAEDLWDQFTPENDGSEIYLSSPAGKQRRVYMPGAIPLAVVGALVKKWGDDGLTGRWTLDTLRGAFRAEGKGNHPWYLVFVAPGDDSTPRIWKVSRGPGGTDHAALVTDGQEFR